MLDWNTGLTFMFLPHNHDNSLAALTGTQKGHKKLLKQPDVSAEGVLSVKIVHSTQYH